MIYGIILAIIGLCFAFQVITAFILTLFGFLSFYAKFVGNFYVDHPKDWYDRCMHVFYIANYGLAYSHYIKTMKKYKGMKGKVVYALQWLLFIMIALVLLSLARQIRESYF
ncbi:hypothetical protein CHH52_14675 [Shouchella clausii]|nr:hypothetical protein CHH52_14675 [Shouchella clausii]